jgi:hypothetical protein
MKLYLIKHYQTFLLYAGLIGQLGSIGYLGYEGYLERQFYPSGGAPPIGAAVRVAYETFALSMVFTIALLVHRRMQRIERTQDWHIEAVNFHIQNLSEHIRDIAEHTNDKTFELPEHGDNAENVETIEASLPIDGRTKASEKPSRWPWGDHHTETLGHLEAAAKRFWTLYDRDDIGTAPTNETVATWLHSERGISKEKARAIASMLRPDGLPTGPRR